MSLQLFDIAMEPLAIILRETTNLIGVQRAGHLHKVSLYADDLVHFLSDPGTTIPMALELISKFGQISGYK